MPLRLQNAPHFEKDSKSGGTGMGVATPATPFRTPPPALRLLPDQIAPPHTVRLVV